MWNILGKVLLTEVISGTVRKMFKHNEEKSNMYDSKGLLASKTVWGGLIAIGASVASFWGIDVPADAQSQLVQLITTVAGSVGGVVAIIGRILADKKIK